MNTATPALSANMEDYLEAIFLLVEEHQVARSKAISERLNVNRSSVTSALQSLARQGLVNYERYGYVTLSPKGNEVARRIVRRHEALRDFFVQVLSINPEEADEAACRMEHGVSKAIVDRLVEFAEFVETCPRAGVGWIRGFGYQSHEAQHKPETCEQCIADCLKQVRKEHKVREKQAEIIPLSTLQPGERGVIESVGGSGTVRRRIRDMGATPGSLVHVARVAPMGDPVDVKIRGYHLSLRVEDATDIKVRRVS